jgi:uncharacterized protein (DUF924 family)
MIASPEQVLGFWFGPPPASEAELMERVRRWFGGGAELDREVSTDFAATLEAALRGELDGWAQTPRGRLALVIVLDQLSRNILRDQPRMYAGDHKAQQLAREAFERGLDRGLDYPGRLFLSMPLLHSEDLGLHESLASIAGELASAAPPLYAPMVAMHAEQVAKYRDVIARFGRFPHRNAILGRASTDEERAFIEDWDSKAPPRGMPARR